MLIHLIPRLFACVVTEPRCDLHDFESPQLGLKLSAETDLVGRRPFLNKNYLVANRRIGRKAMNGFLIETRSPIQAFTTITRWNVVGVGLVTHTIIHRVLDAELDAVTEDMLYWHGRSEAEGGFAARWPQGVNDIPVQQQPTMALQADEQDSRCVDAFNADGVLVARIEDFHMHTIERARIMDPRWREQDRLPDPATAFQASV